MNNKLLFEGIKMGIENAGGKLIKVDDEAVYFEILKGSEMDNQEYLERTKTVIERAFKLKLRIKIV